MDTSKIIRGIVNGRNYTVTAPIVKEDYGLYLKIEGVELPSTYEVDFSNSENNGTSVTMIGNADGVLIPHQFISTGKDVFAFLYHVGEDFGRTVYKFRIPNKLRPDRTNIAPTPEEQSVIDQAISALNEAVEQTAQDVISADASTQSAQGYAEQAESARDTAQTYANNAQTSATQASTSASQASASATASANSASASAQIKADVEELVDDAQGYAESAGQSATASANSATTAQGYAQSASSSAQSASDYASQAQTSANTASAKAQDASQSATTASDKATESAQSASQALTYKTDAESAKTASQTAQGLAESARDTAVSAKTDAESARDDAETARDEAQSAVASISGALIEKAPVITDTASGSIASFPDGADNLPLKSLVVDIDPIQDLHGQDAPYPAGGGKNKLPTIDATQTINGVTWTLNSDGSIKLTGTATANSVYDFGRDVVTLSAGTYTTHDITASGVYTVTIFKIVNGTASVVKSGGGSFTLSEETSIFVRYVVLNGTTANTTIYPQVESGSTATAYAPYENLCPISGWTQVDVVKTGKNLVEGYFPFTLSLLNGVVYLGGVRGDTEGTTIYFPCKKGVTYVRSHLPNDSSNRSYWGAFDHFPEPKDSTADIQNGGLTFTPSVNGYCCIYLKNAADAELINFWQVEVGTTATDYVESQNNTHINISLGQTVYGGKLDVLSGVLTVDRAMVDLGTLSWNRTTSYPHPVFYADLENKKNPAQFLCSIFKFTGNFSGVSAFLNTGGNSTLGNCSTNKQIYVREDSCGSISAFVDFVRNQHIVCELATPITIQLTPNQVNSLLGVNNIWADSGDTEVEYRADTKAWIQRKIAEAIASLT